MFPILARTSLDSIVNSLNPLKLVWFDREKPLNQLVDNWAKAFVKLNKNTISDMHKSNSTKVWAQHINPDSGQLKNDKKWEDIRKDMKTLYSMAKPKFKVTVDDWLLGLHTTADRKDMFSQKHNKEIDSSSMGEFGMCKYNEKQHMVILESRLAIKVELCRWKEHALTIYDKLMA